MKLRFLVLPVCLLIAGCSSDPTPAPDGGTIQTKTDAEFQREVTLNIKTYLQAELNAFYQAIVDLHAAVPTPTGRGWDKTQDAQAIERMKTAWRRARVHYEHVEGAIAVVFPDLDIAVDERYDGFLADTGPDDDLFDDAGVTGMHAVERVLYADLAPARVVEFEKGLPGYKAAAFPATEAEAADFKLKLVTKLVNDVKKMRDDFGALALDVAFAFRGTRDLVGEQVEKVNKAATGEEESRYAQITMADLRANYEGNLEVYKRFQPWLRSRSEGIPIDDKIMAGMTRLKAAYDLHPGDAIPQPPATWSATSPSEADLQSPFGKLWSVVQNESDPGKVGSVVEQMNAAATLLGFPELSE